MAKRCKDFGGTTKTGKPCNRPRKDSPCPGHEDDEPPLDPDEVRKMGRACFNQKQMADYFGIGKRTLEKYLQNDQLHAAYKKGKAQSDSVAVQALMEKVSEGNITAIIFYLKTQCGWKETDQHEITGKDGQPIQVERLSEEDIKEATEQHERAFRSLFDRKQARN